MGRLDRLDVLDQAEGQPAESIKPFQSQEMFNRIEVRMIAIEIVARRINDAEMVAFAAFRIAETQRHDGLNSSVEIIHRIVMRKSDVVVVGRAHVETQCVMETARGRRKLGGGL